MGFPLKSTPVTGLMEHILTCNEESENTTARLPSIIKRCKAFCIILTFSLFAEFDAENISQKIISENKCCEQDLFSSNDVLSMIFKPCPQTDQFVVYLLEMLRKMCSEVKNLSTDDDKFDTEYEFSVSILYRAQQIKRCDKKHAQKWLKYRWIRWCALSNSLRLDSLSPFEGGPLEGCKLWEHSKRVVSILKT